MKWRERRDLSPRDVLKKVTKIYDVIAEQPLNIGRTYIRQGVPVGLENDILNRFKKGNYTLGDAMTDQARILTAVSPRDIDYAEKLGLQLMETALIMTVARAAREKLAELEERTP